MPTPGPAHVRPIRIRETVRICKPVPENERVPTPKLTTATATVLPEKKVSEIEMFDCISFNVLRHVHEMHSATLLF